MNLAAITSIGDLLAGLATIGALIFALVEIPRGRRQRLDDRAHEVAGVGLELIPVRRPLASDFRHNLGDFWYDITLDNPGRFPISEVTVDITFPGNVARVHGTGAVEEATRFMRLVAPVVLSRGRRTWHRRIRVNRETSELMHQTVAKVSFSRIDVGRVASPWPPKAHGFKPPTRLKRQLHEHGVEIESASMDRPQASAIPTHHNPQP